MNGLIYTRVSSNEQVGNTSLPQQKKQCLELARKQKVNILEECIFEEEGESAKVVNRTELQNLLNYVRKNKGKVEVLYIWKIDRLSRSLGDYYGIKVALNKYGVKIVSVTEPIEDDPVGRFLEAILAAAAQFDNEIRAVRSLGGMRSRVEQGEWPHDAPVGYLKKDKRVVIDPQFGPVIKDILIMFSKGGWSYQDLSKYAFDKGIMTKRGKPKSGDQMKSIVRNWIYAGYTVNKLSTKGAVKGRHEALVDIEIIKTNRKIVEGNLKDYTLHGDDLFPLRGTLLCTVCHKTLTGSRAKGQSGLRYPIYTCNRKTCTKKITQRERVSQPVEVVHEGFRELLKALGPIDKKTARLYKTIVMRNWNDQFESTTKSILDVQAKLANANQFKAGITRKFIEEKISLEDKEQQMAVAEDEIDMLTLELNRLENYRAVNEEVG